MVCELTLTVGAVFTLTVPLAVEEQPDNVYVTVYVVLVIGLTVILCVLCPPGDHAYVPPGVEGVAVSVVLCPEQMVWELTLTVGAVLTLTVPLAVEEHPDNEYMTV